MNTMKIRNCIGTASIFLPIFLLLFLASCAAKPDIIGKWREIGKEATLEFSADGTFKAVDNQGMAVSGTYILSRDGNVRCEIGLGGASKDVVDLMIAIRGDEMTLTSSDSPEVETYRREK